MRPMRRALGRSGPRRLAVVVALVLGLVVTLFVASSVSPAGPGHHQADAHQAPWQRVQWEDENIAHDKLGQPAEVPDSRYAAAADAVEGWRNRIGDAFQSGWNRVVGDGDGSASDLESVKHELEETLRLLDERRREVSNLDSQVNSLKSSHRKASQDLDQIKSELSAAKEALRKAEQQKDAKRNEERRQIEVKQKELDEADIKAKEKASFRKHMFNEYRSSLIPLDRPIPDVRVGECKSIKYDITKMPKMSVIICFVNEAWSALLRTVWSVLNRTPPSLLEEIVLVDDASDADWLGSKLIDYVNNELPSKVKMVRSDKRLGLIRARLLGAQNAKGPVMTFLDSHCEANVQWAEPILDIIGKDRTHVVTPVIDAINHDTMEYPSGVSRMPAVGTFDWTMDFNWKSGKFTRPGQRVTDPLDSPTMAGGLFSIDRSYFYEIGSYDEDMDGWGGENLEMSFRIWQCGGKLVTAPCSHVGHIFRDSHPYSVPGTTIFHTFMKNSMRVAEVWMDDYKKYFYQTRPTNEKVDYGDISARLELRRRLQCKSFKWYLDTILPEQFIPDEEHIIHTGALQSGDGQCLDKMGQRNGGVAGVFFCHGQGGNQAWMFSTANEVRTADSLCLDVYTSVFPAEVHMNRCHGMRGNQEFTFDEASGKLKHKPSGGCLESLENANMQKVLRVIACDASKPSQTWKWVR